MDNDPKANPPDAAESSTENTTPPAQAGIGDAEPLKTEARPSEAGEKKRSSKNPANKKEPARKKSSLLKNLILLLILVALAVGGYLGWHQYGPQLRAQLQDKPPASSAPTPTSSEPSPPAQSQLQETAEPDAGLEALAMLGVRLDRHQAQVDAVRDDVQSRLADIQLQLTSQQERLQTLSTTTREVWLLAEAEYLLRLANQRILTERQTLNATALLETADAILRDLNDSALFAVRKALADDITRVKMAGVVDREGIYLRLDALMSAIPQLRAPMVEDAAADESAAAPEDLSWYLKLAHNARAALVKMSGIVRVERLDAPLEPVLLPSEQELLQLNLRASLEQAQLALMREEPKIFTASLARAEELIAQRFIANQQAEVFRAELSALLAEDIAQPLPVPQASLAALQDYLRTWHNRHPAPEEGSEAGVAP